MKKRWEQYCLPLLTTDLQAALHSISEWTWDEKKKRCVTRCTRCEEVFYFGIAFSDKEHNPSLYFYVNGDKEIIYYLTEIDILDLEYAAEHNQPLTWYNELANEYRCRKFSAFF